MDFKQFYTCAEDEKPLDRMVSDGGFTGIFRTIACVGDSLSSGEFVACSKGCRSYHDMYDCSWGQYLARMAGCRVYNFSCGGLTAEGFITGYADGNGAWESEKAAQAYIIALGVNDILNQGRPIGSTDDICPACPEKNAETFCGWYARIIQRYKEISPAAKFFLVTIPHEELSEEREKAADAHAQAIYALAEYFGCYVIDLRRYGPAYTGEARRIFFLDDHMSPAGYLFTARLMASYIDYIIRKNPDDFLQVGFIGTPWHNDNFPGWESK